MMRTLPAALVALCQWHCLLHSTTTAQQINTDKENWNTANKSLEFVNIIKDDLRRNNDDYELLEGENQLADTAPLAHPDKSSHPVQPVHPAYPMLPGRPTPRQPNRNIISPLVPRLQPAHPPPARSARPPHPRARPAHSPPRAGPLRRFDTRKGEADKNQSASINPNQFRSYTRSKQYKIQRLNKLKQLLNKDEPQVEGQPKAEDTTTASPPATEPTTQSSPPPATEPTTQSSPSPVTEPTTQSSPPPTNPKHKALPSPLTHAPIMQRQPFQPHQVRREQGLMMRSRMDHSPSPEQLDMAPALNAEITRIRLKGRLCQRSLMNAEGPTYDKLGKVLEPAFRPKSKTGRKFYQTRKPSLVLPRCCNCCKKSVLGCQ